MVKRAIDAAAEERAKHERTNEKLSRTEQRLTEIREGREKTVRELREHVGSRGPSGRAAEGARLSYSAFCKDPYLKQRLSDFLFFDTIEFFDAYVALLEGNMPRCGRSSGGRQRWRGVRSHLQMTSARMPHDATIDAFGRASG